MDYYIVGFVVAVVTIATIVERNSAKLLNSYDRRQTQNSFKKYVEYLFVFLVDISVFYNILHSVHVCDRYVHVCDRYVHVCDRYVHVCDRYVHVCDRYVHACDRYVHACDG